MRPNRMFGAILVLFATGGALASLAGSVSPAGHPLSPVGLSSIANSGSADNAAPARLGTSDLLPVSVPQHIGYMSFGAGAAAKSARRAASGRVSAPAAPIVSDPSAVRLAARLRLRAAARDRLSTRAILERRATGAASFHTNTPPPPALV